MMIDLDIKISQVLEVAMELVMCFETARHRLDQTLMECFRKANKAHAEHVAKTKGAAHFGQANFNLKHDNQTHNLKDNGSHQTLVQHGMLHLVYGGQWVESHNMPEALSPTSQDVAHLELKIANPGTGFARGKYSQNTDQVEHDQVRGKPSRRQQCLQTRAPILTP
jgi:hypothetical protein